jgi:hypothetical protein
MLQTEFSFTLPCGYVDAAGTLHRDGVMRRATALDEVEPLADPRVRSNEAYASILLLSRVVVRLGNIAAITPALIEGLYAPDFSYLQDLYVRINTGQDLIETACPHCGTHFTLDLHFDG